MKFFPFLVALLLSAVAFSQVTIKGNIQSYSKKPSSFQSFEVEVITDFITYKKTSIANGTTDKFGNYELTFPLKTTSYLFLTFDKVVRTFFAVPGKSYFIEIKAPLEELSKANSVFVKDLKSAKILNSNKNELNYLIDTLDYACSKFLKENPDGRRNKKVIDEFIANLRLEFTDFEMGYFKDYLKYKEAELLLFIYRTKRKEFAKLYFDSEPELSTHIQKMQVFRSLYKGNLRHRILIDDKSPFHRAFNSGDLSMCLDLIYDAPESSKETRELILLYGIYEVHAQNRYSLRSINRILDLIIENSTYPNNKLIAKHIKEKVTHLKEGYPAPNIVVKKSQINEAFELQKIRNKYVYLCFFNSWDESFTEELELLKIIAKKFATELEIVCIGTDQDLPQFNAIKDKYGADWRFIHYNYQANILMDYNIEDYRIDRYDIETTAKYYLIDPEGDLVFSPAKSPTKGFHRDFERIIAQ